jgi:site-specific recombinase
MKRPAMLDRYVQHVPSAALPWLVMLGAVLALILLALGGDIVIAILGMLVWWVAFPLALRVYMRTRGARQRKFAPTEEP